MGISSILAHPEDAEILSTPRAALEFSKVQPSNVPSEGRVACLLPWGQKGRGA
jgi:hypothetical protein